MGPPPSSNSSTVGRTLVPGSTLMVTEVSVAARGPHNWQNHSTVRFSRSSASGRYARRRPARIRAIRRSRRIIHPRSAPCGWPFQNRGVPRRHSGYRERNGTRVDEYGECGRASSFSWTQKARPNRVSLAGCPQWADGQYCAAIRYGTPHRFAWIAREPAWGC